MSTDNPKDKFNKLHLEQAIGPVKKRIKQAIEQTENALLLKAISKKTGEFPTVFELWNKAKAEIDRLQKELDVKKNDKSIKKAAMLSIEKHYDKLIKNLKEFLENEKNDLLALREFENDMEALLIKEKDKSKMKTRRVNPEKMTAQQIRDQQELKELDAAEKLFHQQMRSFEQERAAVLNFRKLGKELRESQTTPMVQAAIPNSNSNIINNLSNHLYNYVATKLLELEQKKKQWIKRGLSEKDIEAKINLAYELIGRLDGLKNKALERHSDQGKIAEELIQLMQNFKAQDRVIFEQSDRYFKSIRSNSGDFAKLLSVEEKNLKRIQSTLKVTATPKDKPKTSGTPQLRSIDNVFNPLTQASEPLNQISKIHAYYDSLQKELPNSEKYSEAFTPSAKVRTQPVLINMPDEPLEPIQVLKNQIQRELVNTDQIKPNQLNSKEIANLRYAIATLKFMDTILTELEVKDRTEVKSYLTEKLNDLGRQQGNLQLRQGQQENPQLKNVIDLCDQFNHVITNYIAEFEPTSPRFSF